MADELDLERKYNDCCAVLGCNDCISVSQLNWSNITVALANLKVLTKNEACRSLVASDVVCHCKNIIQKSFTLEFEQGCCIRSDIVCFLRNSCVGCRRNQECIIKLGLLPELMEIIDSSLKYDKESGIGEKLGVVKQLVKLGIQLLGNLVTRNEENQQIIWEKCYPDFFSNMLSCHYEEAKNNTCMVMYNCIRQKARCELVSTPEGISLMSNVVEMCCNCKDVEWGIFMIESLLRFGFFPQLFDGLHANHQRVFLLELMEHKLTANEEPALWISVSSACYVAQRFEENIKRLINCEFSFAAEQSSSEVILIGCLLRLLCALTAFSQEYMELRNRVSLVDKALTALRETSTPENQKVFSNIGQFPTAVDNHANCTHPTHGFKRDLVQLIANMCYHNRRNQDCVRQMDCIPLLLEHCNIDDHNPYICQWAIFCLRNVLENNLENQEVIKSLKKLGLARNERLLDAGVLTEGTEDNGIKIFGRQAASKK